LEGTEIEERGVVKEEITGQEADELKEAEIKSVIKKMKLKKAAGIDGN